MKKRKLFKVLAMAFVIGSMSVSSAIDSQAGNNVPPQHFMQCLQARFNCERQCWVEFDTYGYPSEEIDDCINGCTDTFQACIAN